MVTVGAVEAGEVGWCVIIVSVGYFIADVMQADLNRLFAPHIGCQVDIMVATLWAGKLGEHGWVLKAG